MAKFSVSSTSARRSAKHIEQNRLLRLVGQADNREPDGIPWYRSRISSSLEKCSGTGPQAISHAHGALRQSWPAGQPAL